MFEHTTRITRRGMFRSSKRDHVCHDYSSSRKVYPGKVALPVWIAHTNHNIDSFLFTPWYLSTHMRGCISTSFAVARHYSSPGTGYRTVHSSPGMSISTLALFQVHLPLIFTLQ